MKRVLSIIKYFFILLISFCLLFLAFKGVNIKSIFKNISQANLFWIILNVLIGLIALISRAYRWKLLIEPLGYSPSLKKTTYSLSVGYFANLAFPRLGEVSRCGALSKAESIPFNMLLGTVIIERIIDVISLLICMVLVAIIEFKRLGNFFMEAIFDPLFKKINLLLNSPLLLSIGIVVVLSLMGLAYYYAFKKNKENESAFSKILRGFVDGLRSVGKLKKPGQFIFHSIFIWALYYLSVYVSLFTFSFTSQLGPGAALFLLVAGGLGMSAPVQGGIGAYHLLVSQGLLLYGLSQQDGLTFATLLHSLQFVVVIILGVISLIALLYISRKKKSALKK